MFIAMSLVFSATFASLWMRLLAPKLSTFVMARIVRKMDAANYAAHRAAEDIDRAVFIAYKSNSGFWSAEASLQLKLNGYGNFERWADYLCADHKFTAMRAFWRASNGMPSRIQVLNSNGSAVYTLGFELDSGRPDMVVVVVEKVEDELEVMSFKWRNLLKWMSNARSALVFLDARPIFLPSKSNGSAKERLINNVRSHNNVAGFFVDNGILCLLVDLQSYSGSIDGFISEVAEHVESDLESESNALHSIDGSYWLPGWKARRLEEQEIISLYRSWLFRRDSFRGKFFIEESHHTDCYFDVTEDVIEELRLPELKFVYQPVVEMRSGSICAFELLCRGESAEGLMPAAESLRQYKLHGCDDYVIEAAVRSSVQAIEKIGLANDVKFLINVDAKVLSQDGFTMRFADYLLRHGLNPRRVVVELVEDLPIINYEVISSNVNKLRAIGVDVSIDDFGSGYSSLSRLARLDWASIKFEANIFFSTRTAEVIGGIYSNIKRYARSIGAKVVVERVENHEELKRIIDSGFEVEYVQGYYFSKPLVLDELTRLFPELQMECRRKVSVTTCKSIIPDNSYITLLDLEACDELSELTPKERQVLLEVVKGKEYGEIADEQKINYATIAWHMKKIFVKLGVCNKTEAVSYVMGLLIGSARAHRRVS